MVFSLFRKKKEESGPAYHGTVEEAIALARETLSRRTEDTRTLADILSHFERIPVAAPTRLTNRQRESQCEYHACMGLADASDITNRGVTVVGLPEGAKGIWQVFALFEASGTPVYARVFSHDEIDRIDADILGADTVATRAYRVPVKERVQRILELM